MNVGGTEKALLNMIEEFPKDEYEISLLMLEEYGGFLSHIPGHVHIEYVQGYTFMKETLNHSPHLTAFTLLKSGKLFKSFSIISIYMILLTKELVTTTTKII